MKRIVVSTMMGALMLGGVSNVLAQNEINERQRNQQERIGEGVENGSLTAQERRQVNRQQNRESRRIYKQKHDAQHQ